MNLSLIDFGAIIVAAFAALGAWASQRAASKASRSNIMVSGRLEAERDAYERARSFDVDTIVRQEAELKQLRADNTKLREEVNELKARLLRIEHISPQIERLLDASDEQGSNQE